VPFERNLRRYAAGEGLPAPFAFVPDADDADADAHAAAGAVYAFNAAAPSLENARFGFNSWNLTRDILVLLEVRLVQLVSRLGAIAPVCPSLYFAYKFTKP
jgi:hypothetical protein